MVLLVMIVDGLDVTVERRGQGVVDDVFECFFDGLWLFDGLVWKVESSKELSFVADAVETVHWSFEASLRRVEGIFPFSIDGLDIEFSSGDIVDPCLHVSWTYAAAIACRGP